MRLISQPVSTASITTTYPNEIQDLMECGRDFHRRGWSLGTSSNYSVVVNREPLTLLMTGSGFDKGRLQPDQFVLVDEQAQSLDPEFPKPSAEALLHTALAKHAGAGAVLHTHSVYGTVLSEGFLKEGHLRLASYEMLKGLAGIHTHESEALIEIFPNTQDIAALAEVIEKRLQGTDPLKHGFLMAGHGLYTWGKDIAEARRQVEVLEFLFEVVTQKRLIFGGF